MLLSFEPTSIVGFCLCGGEANSAFSFSPAVQLKNSANPASVYGLWIVASGVSTQFLCPTGIAIQGKRIHSYLVRTKFIRRGMHRAQKSCLAGIVCD